MHTSLHSQDNAVFIPHQHITYTIYRSWATSPPERQPQGSKRTATTFLSWDPTAAGGQGDWVHLPFVDPAAARSQTPPAPTAAPPKSATSNPGVILSTVPPAPSAAPSASSFAYNGARLNNSTHSGFYKSLFRVTSVVCLIALLTSADAPNLGPRALEDTSPPPPELISRFPNLFPESFVAGSMTEAGHRWLNDFGRDNHWAQQVANGVGWAFDTHKFGPYPGDPHDPKNVYAQR